MEIKRLHGTDKELYYWVAPLVMNPEVLRKNYNFPFRTSEHFEWFVAIDGDKVCGFMPVEHKRSEAVINNYYVQNRDSDVLGLLLQEVLRVLDSKEQLSIVSFLEDASLFAESGFVETKKWTRYVKMTKE